MTTSRVTDLLAANKAWAAQQETDEPGFFSGLAAQQKPDYLWIGCADSRVPANQITGMRPGEVFVHRNVANLVQPADINVLTVIAYAVNALGVEDIIVCGHYGCGGVQAVVDGGNLGMLADWLWQIRAIEATHTGDLAGRDPVERARRLCELNVIEQVINVARTSVVQQAWEDGKRLSLHGWVYGLEDGLLRDLSVSASSTDELQARYDELIAG